MIIIIGDSWGVGEWGFEKGSLCVTGPGFATLISLHDQVINLSVGGGSNTESLNRLDKLFCQYTPDPIDRFFWVVTCPSRCITDYSDLKDKNFKDVIEQHLYSALSRADCIAKQACIKIELIGGLCDLKNEYIEYFSNLEILVSSWGEMLDKNYPASIFSPDSKILKLTQRDENILLDIEKKYNFWQNSEFFPDDGHPGANAHRILRDKIFPIWSHKY